MAAGKINLQKASGGVTVITGVDGTGNTELVVPESGNLVSVDTAVTDNAIARYDSTTGKLQNSGVVIDDNGNLLVGTTTDNGIDKLQVNGSSNIYGLNTALQYKRTSNYASGMSGHFGDKIEYAMRAVISSITKTFRVTNSTPSNNENFGLFFKARWAIYNQTPCVGSYEYCVGFKQPGSGATCVFVNATSGNAIGATSPLSVSSTAINSTSFDVTITVNSYYTNVVLELEAIFTSGTCTITPL